VSWSPIWSDSLTNSTVATTLLGSLKTMSPMLCYGTISHIGSSPISLSYYSILLFKNDRISLLGKAPCWNQTNRNTQRINEETLDIHNQRLLTLFLFTVSSLKKRQFLQRELFNTNINVI
jgi:hypothetical protein